jgi:hypothetical protein
MRTALPALILLAVPGATHAATTIATGTGPEIPWFRLFLALVFCLLLAWGAIVLIRHRQGRGLAKPLAAMLGAARTAAPRRIRIIETRRASQHGDLCLVECDDQLFFLAITAQGVTVLDRRGTGAADRA